MLQAYDQNVWFEPKVPQFKEFLNGIKLWLKPDEVGTDAAEKHAEVNACEQMADNVHVEGDES